VDNVYLPGADGELGVLPQHAGLVTALQPGELRYLHDGKVETMAIGSGFAEITQTHVVVLTDMALGEHDIDISQMEAAIQRAKEELQSDEHSMDVEEIAFLQGTIAKSTAAINFKRHRM
jgi:F-type H+-transporting ATPase subunit epsilon